jgi:hypothetical protein
MSYEKNAYYNPDALGLNVVAELEFSDLCYQYDTRVVWEKDGALYTARDSGCSCPKPFEGYTSVESLERVDLDALESEVKAERYIGNSNFDRDSREFLSNVSAALG